MAKPVKARNGRGANQLVCSLYDDTTMILSYKETKELFALCLGNIKYESN